METDYELFKKQKVKRKNSIPKGRQGRRQLAEVKNPVLREKIDESLKTGYVLIRSNCVNKPLKKSEKIQNYGTI